MTLAWFAAGVQAGVRPALGRTVKRILVNRGRAYGVDTDAGPIHAGTVVLAAGSWGRELAQTASSSRSRCDASRSRSYASLRTGRRCRSRSPTWLQRHGVMRPDRAGLAWVVAYQPESAVQAATTALVSSAPSTNRQSAPGLRVQVPSHTGARMGRRIRRRLRLHARLESPRRPRLQGSTGSTALGWSGHGFKLAPSVGEVVADEIVGRTPEIDVSPLAPDRFERGAPLRLAYGPGARA